MRRIMAALAAGLMALGAYAGEPVEMLAFSMPNGEGGMKLAFRKDSTQNWRTIGNHWSFLGSDYGAWGSQKKMHNVRLTRDDDGEWWVLFNPDSNGTVTAITHSPDLVNWTVQEYRRTEDIESVLDEMGRLRRSQRIFKENAPLSSQRIFIENAPLRADAPLWMVEGTEVIGTKVEVDSDLIESLEGYVHYRNELNTLNDERTDQDPWRFKNLGHLTANVRLDKDGAKKITDKFIGIFFEDINYAADGGLYAEMVQNRDFEYSQGEKWNNEEWNGTEAWNVTGNAMMMLGEDSPIHPNNRHYAILDIGAKGGALSNLGYDGMDVKKGDKYLFSVFARSETKTGMKIQLVNKDGKVIGSTQVTVPAGNEWAKLEANITAKETAAEVQLRLEPTKTGRINLDMVSLFPEKTYKGRKNGLRPDLAQALADLKPRFMRFPGGCVSHGNGIDNIYDWKGSVGPLVARRPLPNTWGYHQSRGLGFYEYFQFCEDLGMEPLPVLAAGVPCQNSWARAHCSHDALTTDGQQGGIPMEEMPAYIQDVLDLVEWANGSADSEWGKVRAEAGHPEPFNLKYLGIGNEDLISEVFKVRFKMIKDAVNERYPEIVVVGTVGPFFEGPDYTAGWEFARQEEIPIVDEHYYVAPGWFVNNRDFYDNYDRNGTKVYLGEYASHYPGRESNLEAALSIALYMTDVERNGDVVEMTSYAPLFAKKHHTQWKPDLIFFNNESVMLTPDYHVQKMYGQNAGTVYVPSTISLTDNGRSVKEDVSNRFGVSTVIDEETGDTIVRIASLLPVGITVNLDGYPTGTAEVTTLSGKPRDTDAAAFSRQVQFDGKMEVEPYSFTVVRIRKQ